MSKENNFATLPLTYDTYIFDLYGTLVDIKTDESDMMLLGKACAFYGYYDAIYEPMEFKTRYGQLVGAKEADLKLSLQADAKYSHEASPEIEITEVFEALFTEKGVTPTKELAIHAGQLFRVISTDHVNVYPGTEEMLANLKKENKKVYLLSNAQRIFTEYEMHVLKIAKYFDGILISSDYKTRKPDKRFFDTIIEKYDINNESAIFVGNDSTTDIAGAQSVALDTFYVKSNISPEGDWAESATYTVDNFIGWKL